MEEWEKPRVGASSFQHNLWLKGVEGMGHAAGGEASGPLVEVSEDGARSGPGFLFEQIEEVADLVAALDEASAQVQIEGMDCGRNVKPEVGAKAAARFAAKVGEVVVVEGFDRKAAEGHIAVCAAMEWAVFSDAPRIAGERVGQVTGLIEFCGAIADVEYLLQAYEG